MTTASASRNPSAGSDPAAIFRALADPTRLRILNLLRGGEQCVCDLQTALDTAQSLLSFHLKALRDADLVTYRKDGRWAYYALRDSGLRDAHDALAALRQPKRPRLPIKCCD